MRSEQKNVSAGNGSLSSEASFAQIVRIAVRCDRIGVCVSSTDVAFVTRTDTG